MRVELVDSSVASEALHVLEEEQELAAPHEAAVVSIVEDVVGLATTGACVDTARLRAARRQRGCALAWSGAKVPRVHVALLLRTVVGTQLSDAESALLGQLRVAGLATVVAWTEKDELASSYAAPCACRALPACSAAAPNPRSPSLARSISICRWQSAMFHRFTGDARQARLALTNPISLPLSPRAQTRRRRHL